MTPVKRFSSAPIFRRLLPLYAAIFFQSIPLWYATEKLFMLDIGFSTATIGIMLACMNVVTLAVETPSGILADRWSRKGVLTLASLALLASACTALVSYGEPMYILSTMFWGIFAALSSGTTDAVIYDTTVEEYGDSTHFEKYFGWLKALQGVTFIAGALLGAYLASAFGLREPYLLSVPLIACSLFFLWKFREPQLHKAEVSVPVFRHIRHTFAAVLRNPVLLPVVAATVGFTVLAELVFELSQLWFIAVAAPVSLYGVFNAAVFSSWTTGGLLAARVRSKTAVISLMVVAVAMVALLSASRQYLLVLASQVVMAVCLVAIGVILAKKLHDELPSRLRAGSSSVISTIARIIIIPGGLVVTGVGQAYGMPVATYILLGVALVSACLFMMIKPASNAGAVSVR
jgi:MFS family permease